MYLKFNDIRKSLPKQVSEFVIGRAKELRIRKIRVELGSKCYFGEDCKYTVIRDQVLGSMRCGGEWGGYVKGDFINQTGEIPVGSYVVEERIFLGKYFLTVTHNNGQAQIAKSYLTHDEQCDYMTDWANEQVMESES